MSFKPQHKTRCYCSKKVCYCRPKFSQTKTKTKTTPATNKTGVNTTKTKFTKIIRLKNRVDNTNQKHELISAIKNRNNNNINLSLTCGNSSVTLSSKSPITTRNAGAEMHTHHVNSPAVKTCCEPNHLNSVQQNATLGSREPYVEQLYSSYTDRRSCYERMKPLFSPNDHRPTSCSRWPRSDFTSFLQKDSSSFWELQRFRLTNLDECFNICRKHDLKMQQRLTMNSWLNNPPNESDLRWKNGVHYSTSSSTIQGSQRRSEKSTTPSSSPKRTEDDVRKLENYYNKLKGPLSKSYALVFQ